MISVINYVGEQFSNGGIESFVTNMAEKNKGQIKYDICVNRKGNSIYSDRLRETGSDVFYLSEKEDNYFLKLIKLFLFFSRNKSSVVVFHASSEALYLHCLLARIAGVKKIVYHLHSLPDKNLSYIRKIKNRVLKGLFSDIPGANIVCSQSAGNIFYASNFTVINNGVDLRKFAFSFENRNRLRSEYKVEGKLVIGQIGRLAYPKNQIFSVRLIEDLVKQEKRNVCLLLIGSGPDKLFVEEYVKGNGLSEFVRFIEALPNIHELYSMLDIVLFPSLFEGLGIVAIEAQANGLDVICSEGIPREALVTDNSVQISLNDYSLWENYLDSFEYSLSKRAKNSFDNMEKLETHGFSSIDSFQKLVDIFLNV